MSLTDRQNRLLLAEDWKRIYQSFKYADFKSYDFDNLRRTMIEYIRTNYPEDFNDYTESSEYLALIDLIAFLGQNLSFRIDLNARENFIELAERRESVLRLARLLSYSPKRNRAANGLLKISSLTTTENIVDNNGRNLSGKNIVWNDNVNPDWYEQFVKVLNSCLPAINQFGRPIKLETISGIPTEQYRFNTTAQGVPIYTFSKNVNGRNTKFEIVSTGIENGEIVEEPPNPFNQLGFIYRDNGQGPGSSSTGFFMHFREGVLQKGDFSIDAPTPNQKIDINVSNINQTDVWLYRLDATGVESELWNKVDAVEGNNIVYNSLNKRIRNIFSVLTRIDDRISLIFSDGVFGELPKGLFRAYYRTSINKDYTILPASITNVTLRIPYVSRVGRVENLVITLDLKTTVSNATGSESTESIKSNAPSTYYTQNRLITGEDYNVGPLGISQDIIKVKSVNRTSSGISRYLDILDATGKYSKTNIFGTDGVLYKKPELQKASVKFVNRTEIEQIIENDITNILKDKTVRNFYLSEFPEQNYDELDLRWVSSSSTTNQSTGVIKESSSIAVQSGVFVDSGTATGQTVGSFTGTSLKFIEPDAMIKFVPPSGYVYDRDNRLVVDDGSFIENKKYYIWCKVVSVLGAGNTVTNGTGSIILNDIIPTGSIISKVKIKFVKSPSNDLKLQIIDQMFAYRAFGLRYDQNLRRWVIITQENLSLYGGFSLSDAGATNDSQSDSSWVLKFETDGVNYNLTYRTLRYIFESEAEVKFYFDGSNKIYDSKTGKIIRDTIKILDINTRPNSITPFAGDYYWEIFKEYRDISGYVDSKKLEVVFFDSDEDGVIDNPDIFVDVVNPSNAENLIFTKRVIKNGNEFEVYVDKEKENIKTDPYSLDNGDVYYNRVTGVFKRYNKVTGEYTTVYDYRVYVGRPKLKFQYTHASDENRRIDPSSTNIIDTYILTRSYDTQFRQYLSDPNNNERPLPPSSDSLFLSYSTELNKIKSISDEIIYHPVKYRMLFGNKSDVNMQATFKIVKNPERVVNDNDMKSKVITSINRFFALDNWDFGDTFYFSELSAYVMRELAPDLSSIVIVPNAPDQSFGSLIEIKAEADEIFISSATVDNVEIISTNTADKLKAQGVYVSENTVSNSSTSGLSISPTVGGFTY